MLPVSGSAPLPPSRRPQRSEFEGHEERAGGRRLAASARAFVRFRTVSLKAAAEAEEAAEEEVRAADM